MGMFNFIKKGKENEGYEPREGSEFSLMVEDAFFLKNKDGVVVAGNVHGEIRVGDVAYILHHAKAVTPVKVRAIEIGKDKGAEVAKDQHVALLLDGITSREDVPKYTVLSPKKPGQAAAEKEEIDNPMLLGLSMEYVEHSREEQYLNTLIYAATHSTFLTPVKMSNKPDKAEGEEITFSGNTTVEFSGLTNPQLPDISIFPIFTDYKALNMSGATPDGGETKDTMILTFPNVVSVANNGYAGAVINPFGPVPVFMPITLIEHITTLQGYKEEFGA